MQSMKVGKFVYLDYEPSQLCSNLPVKVRNHRLHRVNLYGVVHKLCLQNLDNFDHVSISVDTISTLIVDRDWHFFNHVCMSFCKRSS